ncbi:MAG TPA: TolC family protein [Gemmatimonadaceae bacterium]
MNTAPLTRTTSLRTALGAMTLLLGAAPALRAQDSTAAGQPVVLSLGDAVRLAARQSPTAELGRYRAAEARARVTQSRSALLPNVSADASRNGRTFNTATFGIPFPGFNPYGQVLGPVILTDLRAKAQMNLLDLSAFARIRAARSAAEAGSLDAQAAAENAASQAAGAYLRALRADAQLRARAEDSTLAAELLGIAREQLRAGTGTALDVTRAQSQAAGVRAQLIAARSERSRTRLELLRSLGLPLDVNLQLSDSLERLTPGDTIPTAEAATERAVANRPDVRAAEQQYRAARQSVKAIQAERLPTIGAFGDRGAIGPRNDHLLNTYDWGVQLSVPIFDGFRREGRIEEQRAVSNEADVRRRDLRAQAGVEVRSALLDIGSAREQVDAARERLRLAEQEVSQARERFAAGVGGNADVVTAALGLTAARNQLLDALTLYQSARVSLARAEGAATSIQ